MNDAITVGETLTYYPPKKAVDDNLHWPAKVEDVAGKLVKVTLFTENEPGGVVKHVSRKRLVRGQGNLL